MHISASKMMRTKIINGNIESRLNKCDSKINYFPNWNILHL